MRRNFAAVAALAIALFVVMGCSKRAPRESNGTPRPTTPAGTTANPNGQPSTLVVGISAEPDLLNPLVSTAGISREFNDLLFLRLVEYGPPPNLDFVPLLAKSWEFSPDAKTLTYTLRDDIHWEDGTLTTAEDVAFTFARMMDPASTFPSKSVYRRVDSCKVLAADRVEFRFNEVPTEPLFETMFHVLPKHLLEKIPVAELGSNVFSRAPTGNGRWRLLEWVSDSRLVFEAAPDSPLGRPHFDRLVVRIIPEETTMRTELLTGGVDVCHRYPNRFFREDSKNENLGFVRVPDRGYTYVGWNQKCPLFQDVKVREALTRAIDRQTIIDAFRDGFGKVVAVPLYPEHPDFNPQVQPLPFDTGGAARLLDEAGWNTKDSDGIRTKDGRRFEFTLLLISNNTISEEIATMMQAEFKKLGIAFGTESFEFSVYLEKLHSKVFDATILQRRGDFIYDPESVFHSRGIEGQYNDVSYSSPEFDRLIDQAKHTVDRVERRHVWHEFQAQFAREIPVTVLYVGDALYPVRKDRVEEPLMDLRGVFVRMHEWKPKQRTS